MTIASEDERKKLLLSYIEMEPVVTVNGFSYEISACVDDEGAMFYCVNPYTQRLGATVLCPRSTWEECNTGLSIAFLYNIVLEICEDSIKKNDGIPLHYVRGVNERQNPSGILASRTWNVEP
jgi:hypothetical protein